MPAAALRCLLLELPAALYVCSLGAVLRLVLILCRRHTSSKGPSNDLGQRDACQHPGPGLGQLPRGVEQAAVPPAASSCGHAMHTDSSGALAKCAAGMSCCCADTAGMSHGWAACLHNADWPTMKRGIAPVRLLRQACSLGGLAQANSLPCALRRMLWAGDGCTNRARYMMAHHMPGMVPLSAQPRAMRSAKNCHRVRMSAQAEATRPQTMTREPSQRLAPTRSSTMLLGTCEDNHWRLQDTRHILYKCSQQHTEQHANITRLAVR